MKKNLITIVILALVLANLILTAVLTISILPQTKKANELITKVCAAIDLDLEGGDNTSVVDSVPMAQSDTYAIEDDMVIPLKKGEDGKEHFAVLSVAIIMDTKAEGYKDYGSAEAMKAKEPMIKDKINTVVGEYSIDEIRDSQTEMQSKIVQALRDMYGADFIYQVAFSKVTYQ